MKQTSLRTAILLYVVFAIALIASAIGISSGNKFDYEHRDAIERVGYEPAPEINRYHISTSLAWEATNDGAAGLFKAVGVIIFAAFGVFLFLLGTDRIILPKDSTNRYVFIVLVVVAACLFAAYSSTYVSNWIDVTPDQHKVIQENKSILVETFKAKELIK